MTRIKGPESPRKQNDGKGSPIAAAIRAAGDVNAGVLLYRIRYWQPKASIRHMDNSGRWIAKTRGEWCAETGLTLEQHKRALPLLVKRGLVETILKRFIEWWL
jgi:hypothetical protein